MCEHVPGGLPQDPARPQSPVAGPCLYSDFEDDRPPPDRTRDRIFSAGGEDGGLKKDRAFPCKHQAVEGDIVLDERCKLHVCALASQAGMVWFGINCLQWMFFAPLRLFEGWYVHLIGSNVKSGADVLTSCSLLSSHTPLDWGPHLPPNLGIVPCTLQDPPVCLKVPIR